MLAQGNRNPPSDTGLWSPGPLQRGLSMKWMLVVLVGGMTPVQTDVIFEKLSDCLAAEEQLRKAYTDALDGMGQAGCLNV